MLLIFASRDVDMSGHVTSCFDENHVRKTCFLACEYISLSVRLFVCSSVGVGVECLLCFVSLSDVLQSLFLCLFVVSF